MRVFGGVRFDHLFSFLCCPIMCPYVLSSVLWCPLRFPHKKVVLFVFTSSCLQEGSCLIYVVCVCLVCLYLQLFAGGLMSYLCYLCLLGYNGVQHILCSAFSLFGFVFCTLCCQFLWIVHCWLSLRYSLTFISFIVTLITYKLDYLKCLIYRIRDFSVLDCVCNDQYKTDIVKLVVFHLCHVNFL